MMNMHQGNDPHHDTPVMGMGADLTSAKAAMIMIHGRGASASSILALAAEFKKNEVAYLAPQAAANTWYPHRFIEPVQVNEPSLSSALKKIGAVVDHVIASGLPAEKILLLGFSQGACLSAEYIARNPRRYGGVAVLSGGLIGDQLQDYAHTGENPLQGTPVFFGCSDIDFHIPESRVHESADKLKALGGEVTTRIYPGMDHTINQDEINQVIGMIQAVVE